jgi:hypothetical protein
MTTTTTISTISTQGKAFVDESGNRFIVRGVALSSNNADVDLLADDYLDYMTDYVLPALQYLNVNLVRVYQVDTTKSHGKVMALLAANNIYAMVGMMDSAVSIDRNAPVYTPQMEERVCQIAAEFCTYPNTFAFSVGNEVVFPGEIYNSTGDNGTTANQIILTDAIVMKLLIKTLKAYMQANSLRMVPVGMAMQDGDTSTLSTWSGIGTDLIAQLYAYGDATERADFIGINTYAYIPGGPMNAYDRLAQEVDGSYAAVPEEDNLNIPVPVFLTETGGFGTPVVERDWAIVPQMYTEATLYNNLSGQIAFQFFEKGAGFGLYTESPAAAANPVTPPTPIIPLPVTTYGGAANLSTEFGAVISDSVPMPTANPGTIIFPTALQQATSTFSAQLVTITINNNADIPLVAVQNGTTIAKLPPINGTTPSKTSAIVFYNSELLIQDPTNWNVICRFAANIIAQGLIVNVM